MPPKTVTCAVCQKEVLKAHTLARKDGSRACREHEGVQQEAQALHQQDQQRREKEVCKPKPRRPFDAGYHSPNYDKIMEEAQEFRAWAYSHCWTCGEEGISLREHFAQCMIADKRLQLRGEWNFLTLPQDRAKLMGEQRVLAMLPYDDQKDGWLRRFITSRKIKDIIHFLRTIHMCVPCVMKHKLDARLDMLFPKPTMEQLESMFPIVEALDPIITAIAEKKERQS